MCDAVRNLGEEPGQGFAACGPGEEEVELLVHEEERFLGDGEHVEVQVEEGLQGGVELEEVLEG